MYLRWRGYTHTHKLILSCIDKGQDLCVYVKIVMCSTDELHVYNRNGRGGGLLQNSFFSVFLIELSDIHITHNT